MPFEVLCLFAGFNFVDYICSSSLIAGPMNEDTKRKLAALKQARKQVPGETISPIQNLNTPAKRGRPTSKDPQLNYVKVTSRIPEEVLRQLKMALLTTHREYKTQDEFIRAAIEAFLGQEEEA